MRLLVILAFAGVLLSDATAQEGSSPPVVPICDVLRNPPLFNGKVIAIRGERLVGGHGLYLAGPNCADVVGTKGYRWPSFIWIENGRKEMESRGYSMDEYEKAILEIGRVSRSALERKGPGAKIARVEVTLVGLFETHRDFDSAVFARPDGSIVGAGFGQVPGAPGQLFVKSVRDISVEFETGSLDKR